jgi:hypothetical protein
MRRTLRFSLVATVALHALTFAFRSVASETPARLHEISRPVSVVTPAPAAHLAKLSALLMAFDADHNGILTANEFPSDPAN